MFICGLLAFVIVIDAAAQGKRLEEYSILVVYGAWGNNQDFLLL